MNSRARYGVGAIWLHWLLALIIAGQLGLGFAMPPGAAGFAQYQLHKSIGIAILVLTLARVGWRLAHPAPRPLEQGWQARLAGAVHVGLYAFMLLAPLTGWALVSTADVKVPTVLFGLVPLPHLPLSAALGEAWEEAHEILGFVGVALIGLHVAGALRHHFLLRDGTLRRMAPKGSAGAALVLALAALVLFALPFTLPSPGAPQPAAQVAAADSPAPSPTELSDPTAPGAANDATPSPTPSATPVVEQEADAQPLPAGPPPEWTIAPGGRLGFSVGNGSDTISGRFNRWSGQIAFDPDNPESARLRIDVDLASASIGDATQDSMLQSADFLDSGSSPRATWRSTSVRKTGSGYEAQGVLTLRGKSHSVPLRFSLSGQGNRRQASGTATVDRAAFGIGQGDAGASLAPRVNVEFSFAASRQ